MNQNYKNISLIIGFLIALFICIKIPIRQTLLAKKEYSELTQTKAQLSSIPIQIVNLKKEEIYLDSVLKRYQFVSTTSFQSNLLQSITQFSKDHSLTVVSFDEPHEFDLETGKVTTYAFSVKGGFNDTLLLLYTLEQVKKLGKISAVSFEKKKNYRTNKDYLITSFLLQRIES